MGTGPAIITGLKVLEGEKILLPKVSRIAWANFKQIKK